MLNILVIALLSLVHFTLCATNMDDMIIGAHLKVYAYDFPPGMSIKRSSSDGNVTFQGSSVDFINYFAEHSQISLEYVQENASVVAVKGQIIAAIQAVVSKEVDFSTAPIGTASIELWPLMDFTSLVFAEAYNIMSPWPEEESRLNAVVRPFNLAIWILILFSSFTFVGFVSLLPSIRFRWNNPLKVEEISPQPESKIQIFGKATMYVIAIFTQHGANPRRIGISNCLSLRLMLGLWLLMTVVLANLYMSTVTSFMTVIKLRPIPNSLEELTDSFDAKAHECLVTSQKGQPWLNTISNSNRTSYRKITKWIKENPQFSTNVFNEITYNVVNHRCAQVALPITHATLIKRDLMKSNGKCRMTRSKKPLGFSHSVSYQLQKNSPYTPTLNKYILRANSMGLTDHWTKSSISNADVDKCTIGHKNNKGDGKAKPIKLIELSSAFLVLGVGLSLSTLTFLVERLFIAPIVSL